MATDEMEKHLLMCFSKTRLTYNSKFQVQVQKQEVLQVLWDLGSLFDDPEDYNTDVWIHSKCLLKDT